MLKSARSSKLLSIFLTCLLIVQLLAGGFLFVPLPKQVQATTTTYDFESDTIGQQPANTTMQRGGTAIVVNDATLGSKAVSLNADAIRIDLSLDNVPLTVNDLDFNFIAKLANGDRLGFLVFANATAQTGYLIQWDNVGDNRVEIFKRNSGSPYTHTLLANSGTMPATNERKWRITVSTTGSATTVTVYSWDGSAWSQELQHTDSSSPYINGGLAISQLVATAAMVVDDISITHTIANSISLTSPVQYQTFQMSTSTEKVVVLNGTNGDSANRVDFLLNLVPLSSTNLDVSFRNPDNGSFNTRPSILLFSNSNADQGYLIQWDSDANGLEIFSRIPDNPYTHSSLTNYGGQPSTTDYKWRVTATVSEGTTTITVYSWNGTSWVQELQTTDSAYTSGGVALNQLNRTTSSEFDNIVINYESGIVTYDFESDTIGEAPANATFIRSGTAQPYVRYSARLGSTGDIAITGTYTGTPTAIEARLNNGDWQTIDSSPTGGNFSGTLTSQSVGQEALEVRFTNDTDTNTSVSNIGIGDVLVVAGQSNAQGSGGSTAQTYSHATLKAIVYDESDTWKEANDPTDTATNNGSAWPLLATLFMADQNVPVAFITTATGATGLVNPADWPKSANDRYTNMLNQINEATGDTGNIKAVLWHQGETDVNNQVSRADYNSALDQLISDIKSDTVSTAKLVVAQLGYKTTGGLSGDTLRNALDAIRLAQSDAWDDNSDILAGPTLYDIDLGDESGDGVHFKTDAELQNLANRWWAALKYHFYSGMDGRGPQLSYATENTDRNEITVVFTNDTSPLLPATGITGFRVEDDGSSATISSVVRSGNNAVVLTLQNALTGTATVSLGSGNDMGNLTDSSTYNLSAESFINESIDKLPSASFDNDFSTWGSGNITVNYNLIDADSDTCNVSQTASSGIEYSTDGSTWQDATDAGGSSEGLTGLSSSASPGENHVFIWDSATDLVNTEDSTVYLRIRPNDGTTDASTWITSDAFGVDNLAPSSVGASSFGTITTSSIEVNKPSTVTENGSGLYQWQVRQNSTTELGLTNASTTSIIDFSLSENTQYTYDVQFKDNQNNLGNYGTQASKYTLIQTPTAISFDGIGVNSLTISATGTISNLTSGSSGLYFDETGGEDGGADSNWTQTNSYQNTGLSENTKYTYRVKARNGDGTETSYTETVSRYTLADIPSNLTATKPSNENNKMNLTVDELPNATVDQSGYYFYRAGDEANYNSGWIQTNTWQDSNFLCNTNYTWYVKYRNGDGVETDPISLQAQTDDCTSAEETSDNLEGDFSFSINNNTETITNQIISLKLFATPGTKKMNISNTPNFSSSNSTGKISFQSPYKFNLCQGQKQCQNGNYAIYIKFYDANDKASEVISSSVVLALDHTPPKQPTSTYPTNNSIIKDNQPTLKGATEPKAKIILELNSKYYYSITADASGNWQYSFIKPLKNGNYTIKITAQDQANNLSKPITLNFIIQTQKAIYKQDSQLEKQSQEKDQEQKDQEKTSESEFEIYQEEETEIDKEPEPELEQEPEPTPEESTVLPSEMQFNHLVFKSPYGNINLMPNIQDQVLKLVPGQTFKAFLRPEKPVKAVKVMIIFEKPREKTTSLNPSFLSNIFSPTLVYAKTWQVAEFTLTDEDQDGIFTGEIKLPETTGEYTARATLYYEDGTIEDLETQILIDPKGYIYTLKDNLEARLPKAIISLYYFNSTTNQFELWQGKTYDQQNPQTTDKTGEYEFLVPAGKYYFKITVPNYQEFQSKEFTAQEGEIISQNIEIKLNPRFNWKVLSVSFGVIIALTVGVLIGRRKNG